MYTIGVTLEDDAIVRKGGLISFLTKTLSRPTIQSLFNKQEMRGKFKYTFA